MSGVGVKYVYSSEFPESPFDACDPVFDWIVVSKPVSTAICTFDALNVRRRLRADT
jgi:hypothetical protein